jgi:hypothetical protein
MHWHTRSSHLIAVNTQLAQLALVLCSAIHEKSLRIGQKKAEAEAAACKAAQDARLAQRRSVVETRVAAHREKIRAAAEERGRREDAYQALLLRTRE